MDHKGPKRFDRKAFNNLPDDEKEKIRKSIKNFHDRMFDVFQKMPSRMMLIMRNLNQIRSIIKVIYAYFYSSVYVEINGKTKD